MIQSVCWKLEDRIKQEINRRIKNDETVRKTLNVHQPGGPLFVRIVEGLVDGGDEPPGVAEDEEPNDRQSDSGDSAFAAA